MKNNNSSGITGIVWDKSRNKWKARVTFQNKTYHLGKFNEIGKAITAREKFLKDTILNIPKVKRKKSKLRSERMTKHGMYGTKIYSSWHSMKDRCNNLNSPDYLDYGGRGISHCKKWEKFEGFYEDMALSYVDGLSLDRINNNGNYEKSNCRWATAIEQNNNKRNNIKITFKNKHYSSLSELSRDIGIKRSILSTRYHKGWSIERILESVTY